MRKKFLSAFMLGLLTLGATSTMTSCKDYDGDISSLKSQIASLEDLVNKKEQTINQSIQNLQNQINQANNDHATKAALQEAKDALQKAIDTEVANRIEKDGILDAAIAKAQGAADVAGNLAKENKGDIEKIVNELSAARGTYGTLSERLAAAETEIGRVDAALQAQIKACDDANSELKKDVEDLKKYVDEQDDKLEKALQKEIDDVKANIGDMSKLEGGYSDLVSAHNALAANVSEIEGNLKTVMEVTIPALEKRLDALDVLTLALAKDLRSLVFIPNLYVDGIETIEYPFIADTTLVKSAEIKLKRQREYGIPDAPETYEKELSNIYDYIYTDASEAWAFGPTRPVEYHGNPGSNNTKFADLNSWYCREVEVATRAAVEKLDIAAPQEKWDNGDMLFNNENGVITAGLKINQPQWLLDNGPKAWAEGETGNKSYGKDNIIALTVKTKNGASDSIVVSDYALLYPERVHPEGIVWVKPNNRGGLGEVDEMGSHSWAYSSALVPCSVEDGKTYHVWDNPQEALLHKDEKKAGAIDGLEKTDLGNPDIALPWNSKDGITLSEFIGTHVQKLCDIKTHTVNCETWANYKEVEKWGLKYIFEKVDYLVDQNTSSYSEYMSIDMETGKIIAGGVDEAGKHVATQAESSVGREPLVRVRLVSKASYEDFKNGKIKQDQIKTFLDGYILVRITKEISTETAVVNDYPEYNTEFTLCDAFLSEKTKWSEFDEYILDNLLGGMDKAVFDAQYTLELEDAQDYNTTGINGHIYRAKVYVKDANGNFVESKYTDYDGIKDNCGTHDPHTVDFGSIIYYEDLNQTANHAFQVALSEDELEKLTHDTEDGKGSFTCYARYKGQLGAKYESIYVKFTVNITRKKYNTGITEKNNNYWFDLNGTDADIKGGNYDAIALNVGEPQSAHQDKCTTWSSDELITLVGNKVAYTNAAYNKGYYLKENATFRKFFFAPINVTIVDQHNKTWEITAKSGATDEEWNSFVCHNSICCADTHDKFNEECTAYVSGKAHSANELANLKKYRPDYVKTADVECNCNLHKSAKYTTHKFQTTEKEVSVVKTFGGAPETVKVLVSDDAANADILDKCAIDYNEGCFTNDALYAHDIAANTYIKIATLDQATGEITLDPAQAKYEMPLDLILNAIGYANDVHGNISAEMRTWVGVVVNNGCDVAVNLFKDKGERNANYSIWEASWQRPINLRNDQPRIIEDADNDGEFISIYDLLSFFDWRGPVKGDMEGANKWLWAYYNIQSVKFDLTPDKVMTNMHQTNKDTFVKLSSISTKVKLYAAENYNPITQQFTLVPGNYVFDSSFDLTAFSSVDRTLALIAYLQTHKDDFGWIYYTNNGENVTKFTVKIPVEIVYQWGHFVTEIAVTIDRSQGN